MAAARRSSPAWASTSARRLPSAETQASVTACFFFGEEEEVGGGGAATSPSPSFERTAPVGLLLLFFFPVGGGASARKRAVSIAEKVGKGAPGERERDGFFDLLFNSLGSQQTKKTGVFLWSDERGEKEEKRPDPRSEKKTQERDNNETRPCEQLVGFQSLVLLSQKLR